MWDMRFFEVQYRKRGVVVEEKYETCGGQLGGVSFQARNMFEY